MQQSATHTHGCVVWCEVCLENIPDKIVIDGGDDLEEKSIMIINAPF